jgi:hypothetical protein
MANRYKDPEPCNRWGPDGPCGAPETRRFVNGWYCPDHTPYALAGREEPKGTGHLYKPLQSGIRQVDYGEIVRQKKRARIDGKRHG